MQRRRPELIHKNKNRHNPLQKQRNKLKKMGAKGWTQAWAKLIWHTNPSCLWSWTQDKAQAMSESLWPQVLVDKTLQRDNQLLSDHIKAHRGLSTDWLQPYPHTAPHNLLLCPLQQTQHSKHIYSGRFSDLYLFSLTNCRILCSFNKLINLSTGHEFEKNKFLFSIVK